MTPEAQAQKIAALERELLSFEREAAASRNATDRDASLRRCEEVRRDIWHWQQGHWVKRSIGDV